MSKSWRCDVCGYIHEGDSPPESCPICGVDSSHFVLVAEPEEGAGVAPEPKPELGPFAALLEEIRAVFQPHAVFAHFPNSLIPTALLFAFLGFVYGTASFDRSVFYLLCLCVVMVPLTFATGFRDWQQRFGGKLSKIFRYKLALATVLQVCLIWAVVWHWRNPGLLNSLSWSMVGFWILLLAIFSCVFMLGHYGGMLVFGQKKD